MIGVLALTAFKSPCSRPSLLLLCAIACSGCLAGSSLAMNTLAAQYQAGAVAPAFVADGVHGPELQLLAGGALAQIAYALMLAFTTWLGYESTTTS